MTSKLRHPKAYVTECQGRLVRHYDGTYAADIINLDELFEKAQREGFETAQAAFLACKTRRDMADIDYEDYKYGGKHG